MPFSVEPCEAVVLRAMHDTLLSLVANCHGDGRPDCPIIDRLES